jgi:hypothetical protein
MWLKREATSNMTAAIGPVSACRLSTRVALLLLAFQGGDAPGGSPDAISFLWREAERTVGVPIVLPSTPELPVFSQGSVNFRPLGRGESSSTETYLRLFIDEFSKYPHSFTRAVNLEWVAFVKGLKVFNDPRAATYLRYFAAGTMAPAGGMVYDVQQGALDETYVRWVLHHEFFHFIDDHLNRDIEDQAWADLNSKEFRYTGVDAPNSTFLDHPRSGAITTYSMKSMWEDRAELFAALFVEKAHPRLREIADVDPVVRSKIRFMMRHLGRIDPSMNERYFRKRLGANWYGLTRGK